MTLLELVQAAQKQNEKPFGKVQDRRSAAIVRATLNELARQIQETKEGEVTLPGFGKFVVKQAKGKNKDGEPVTHRNIVFRRAVTRAKKGEGV